jgi:hypothetical protein
VYLGYEPRDWVAESMARAPAMDAARDSVASAMVAMRSTSPPPVALDRYIGRYDNDVFGPIHIRKEAAGLTLQMGDGQVADLEYHGRDRFFTRWRDPFFREYFGTHVFLPAVEGRVDTLRTQLNRDTFVAVRTR